MHHLAFNTQQHKQRSNTGRLWAVPVTGTIKQQQGTRVHQNSTKPAKIENIRTYQTTRHYRAGHNQGSVQLHTKTNQTDNPTSKVTRAQIRYQGEPTPRAKIPSRKNKWVHVHTTLRFYQYQQASNKATTATTPR
jgi:hypothetical protein